MDHPGYLHDKDDVLKRLRRIEGQARGLQRMVEEEQYCIDILTQVSAMTKALQSVWLPLLDDHLAHCVRDAVASGDGADEKLSEASAAIARLVRSWGRGRRAEAPRGWEAAPGRAGWCPRHREVP